MSITSIAGKLFVPRQKELQHYQNGAEEMQDEVLKYLVNTAASTEYGRNHLFKTIHSYDDFAKNVPLNTYEELKGDIDRMRHGESDILWPGSVNGTLSRRAQPTTRASLFLFLTMVCSAFTIRAERMLWLCISETIPTAVSSMADL